MPQDAPTPETELAGTNARPLNETIAGTGPGIADDALAPGETMPEPPSEAEAQAIADALGVTLPPEQAGASE